VSKAVGLVYEWRCQNGLSVLGLRTLEGFKLLIGMRLTDCLVVLVSLAVGNGKRSTLLYCNQNLKGVVCGS